MPKPKPIRNVPRPQDFIRPGMPYTAEAVAEFYQKFFESKKISEKIAEIAKRANYDVGSEYFQRMITLNMKKLAVQRVAEKIGERKKLSQPDIKQLGKLLFRQTAVVVSEHKRQMQNLFKEKGPNISKFDAEAMTALALAMNDKVRYAVADLIVFYKKHNFNEADVAEMDRLSDSLADIGTKGYQIFREKQLKKRG